MCATSMPLGRMRAHGKLDLEHRSGAPFDRAVVRFGDIAQVLRLADPDWRFALGVDGFQCSQIGAAFVDRHVSASPL